MNVFNTFVNKQFQESFDIIFMKNINIYIYIYEKNQFIIFFFRKKFIKLFAKPIGHHFTFPPKKKKKRPIRGLFGKRFLVTLFVFLEIRMCENKCNVI